jgi:hypothetical protein
MKDFFQADYVDSVTEPGADKVDERRDRRKRLIKLKEESWFLRRDITQKWWRWWGHYDCAANPRPEEMHFKQIRQGTEVIKKLGIGLPGCLL